MHVKGRSNREFDPQVIAAVATVAAIALTGITAWPTKAPVTDLLKMLNVDFFTQHEFINAWGTLMTALGIVISMIDGVIAFVADIKGRGSTAQTPPTKRAGLRGALAHDQFMLWFAIYSWCGALALFGVGILFRLRIL